MHLTDLPTPSLLLDRQVLIRNLEAMRARMTGHGVGLRPHIKTAKSARVAELAHGGVKGPLTVSTLKEAEYFFDHGFTDLTYAVGMAPAKLERAARLRAKGADLKIVTDDPGSAVAIGARAEDLGTRFPVMIELDTGGGRAGVLPDSAALMEIAGALEAASGTQIAGVLTHGGHSYHCSDLAGVRRAAEEERQGLVTAAERLRTAGHACPVTSAGSTPTAVHGQSFEGVDEMRPGVYVFNDLDQVEIGSCRRPDLALSVMASVIGHNRHRGHLLLDAGMLALSEDLSANEFRAEVGYGEVCDLESLAPLPGLFVRNVSQEHGIVPVPEPSAFERLPIGTKVRILPNHACITAAAHDHYQVVEGTEVVDQWDRVNGW